MITLPEDVMLEGFPLITSAVKPIYCLKTEKKNAMLLSRLQVISDNGNEILRVYNPSRQQTVNSAPQPSVNTKVNKGICTNEDLHISNYEFVSQIYDSSTEEEELLDDQLADFSLNNPIDSENSTEIQNLIRKKMELEKRHKLQTRKDRRVKEILEQTNISQCIEVRPKYLIPDTNCFIDFLDHLKTLATTRKLYRLLVPTVGKDFFFYFISLTRR